VRIGVALEHDTLQYADALSGCRVDFVEYGVHLARGVAGWFSRLCAELQVPVHLHPLDINLAEEQGSEDWLHALSVNVCEVGASALVADCGFWFLGHRGRTWERPPDFRENGAQAGRHAGAIATACGIPFRLENPPVDWMPNRPNIWRWLDEISSFEGVELCLDLCHLVQFCDNAFQGPLEMPKSFPWDRVTEIHLGGVIYIEYRGTVLTLDQHLASIDDRQWKLLDDILALRGAGLDVCLEMEPHGAHAFGQTAGMLRNRMLRVASID
jgi:hypothetical protein